MVVFILNLALLLLTPLSSSSNATQIDKNLYQKAHRAFISQNYSLAIQTFQKILESNQNQPKVWYFLALSYFQKNQYSNAKSSLLKAKSFDPSLNFLKSKKNYLRFLSDIRDAINAQQLLDQQFNLNPKPSLPFISLISWLSAITFVLISISGFAFYRYRYRQLQLPSLKSLPLINPESKYKKRLPRLEQLINHLNVEFSQIKQSSHSQSDEPLKHDLLEIERICIALNERFHGMKLGFVNLNEQSISEQFTMTQDLLNQIFSINKQLPSKKNISNS